MKTKIAILLLLTVTSITFGVRVGMFTGWDDLMGNSPEIVIARCTAVQDDGLTPKSSVTYADTFACDIEVLAVLKGTNISNSSTMLSFYRPYRGEFFLFFANDKKDERNKGYSAIEKYRVVPLGRDYNQFIWDHYLAGKPLKEQIQWILKNRLKDLDGEIAQDNEERQRIESGLDETNRVAVPKTNAPPSKPFSGPGKSF